jgi:outer membrane biosynthesis protein TonB
MHEDILNLPSTSLWRFRLSVGILHAFFILYIFSFYKNTPPPSHKVLIVQTVSLKREHFITQAPVGQSASPQTLAVATPPPVPEVAEEEEEEPPEEAPKEQIKEREPEKIATVVLAPKEKIKATSPSRAAIKKTKVAKSKKPGRPAKTVAKKGTGKKSVNKKESNAVVRRGRDEALRKEHEARLSYVQNALTSLQEAQNFSEEIGSIGAKGQAFSGIAIEQPQAIANLASEGISSIGVVEEEGVPLSGKERTYYDELISRLKLSLRLPEYGEVRVRLTVSREGKASKVQILSAKSKKNRDYIQKALPHISLPRFGDNFTKESEHSFCLNLSNEINY